MPDQLTLEQKTGTHPSHPHSVRDPGSCWAGTPGRPDRSGRITSWRVHLFFFSLPFCWPFSFSAAPWPWLCETRQEGGRVHGPAPCLPFHCAVSRSRSFRPSHVPIPPPSSASRAQIYPTRTPRLWISILGAQACLSPRPVWQSKCILSPDRTLPCIQSSPCLLCACYVTVRESQVFTIHDHDSGALFKPLHFMIILFSVSSDLRSSRPS